MPRYKVISPGFYDNKFYEPNGKRPVLDTPKPFTKKNPMPKWLSEMPEESPALKAKREAYDKAAAELADAKADLDKKDIASASTEGDGESTSFLDKAKDATGIKSNNVETL